MCVYICVCDIMDNTQLETKPKCPKCGHVSLRFRTDKSFHCAKCGHDSRDDK